MESRLQHLSLEDQLEVVRLKLKDRKFNFKRNGTFSVAYWEQRYDYASLQCELLDLTTKIKLSNSGPEWMTTEQGKDFMAQLHLRQNFVSLIKRHMQRLREADPSGRVFLKYFSTSPVGLDISYAGIKKRDPEKQRNFREGLIQLTNARDPGDPKELWCPIVQDYFPSAKIVAAHIFPHSHGEDSLVEIFGEESRGELFSPKNGLLMLNEVEKKFDKGKFVLVPDFLNSLQEDGFKQVNKWHDRAPQEYIIRVLDPGAADMDVHIVSKKYMKWSGLDGKKVVFKSDFRPRARYLYFHYVSTMLRRAWKTQKRMDLLSSELGLPCWGTPGDYLSKNKLRAFMEEMGHEVQGDIPARPEGAGLLLTFNSEIQRRLDFAAEEEENLHLAE